MDERLFVDVDDTLIKWGADASFMAKFEPNERVIWFVRNWCQTHPAGRVTVWSLGGKDYAAKHGHDLLPDVEHDAMAKEPLIPHPGWLFLDDDPLPSYRSAAIHPAALEVPA